MRGLWTLSKREFLGYFYAPIAYVVGTAFLAVNGFAFWALMKALSDPKQPAEPGAVLREFFGGTLLHWLMVFAVIALLSMRSVAEDRRSGNWEALLTTRIRAVTVVLAKWLALVGFYVLLWSLTLFLLLVFRQYLPPGQNLDMGPVASAYLALFAIGGTLLAIGLAISACTDNQIVAAVATFAICLLWLMAGEVQSLQGAASAQGSWLLLVDFRQSLAAAARGEVLPGFYLRQLSLVLVVLALASAVAVRQRASRLRLLCASALLVVAGSSASVLVDRHIEPRDVSAERVNSLEDSTEALLAEVQQPVDIILVQPSEQIFDGVHLEVRRMLERMQRLQPLLVRRDVNPLESASLVQEWAFDLAISPEDLSSGGGVIVQQGGRRRAIDLLAMASFAEDDLGVGALSELRAEAAIRQALADVIQRPHERLCASAGHGEFSPYADGLPADQHWQAALARLEDSGAQLEQLFTLEPDSLKGCDSLVIMGPGTSFSAADTLALESYLAAGGNALIALRSDSVASSAQASGAGLRLILARYGVQVLDARVVDPEKEMAGPPDWMTYEGYGDHPIVRDFFQRRATIWSAPLALQAAGAAVQPLVSASEAGWGERDVAALRQEGIRVRDASDSEHVHVALAAESEAGSRLVVIGSAESLSSRWSERGVGGNERFLVSAVLWTLGRDVELARESKRPEHLRLLMGPEDLRRAFVWTVLVGPLCFGILGALLAFWRRREPGQ